MKYLSALFLVLLIAPIAFAQSDAIEMIQKAPEGKEILDSLFLDVSLEGRRINIGRVRARLNAIAKYTRKSRKLIIRVLRYNKKHCIRNVKAAKHQFHKFIVRSMFVKRLLTAARRGQRRRGLLLTRLSQELRHYVAFKRMTRSNGRAWRRFWKKGLRIHRRMISLVSQIRAHVRRLHRHHKKHRSLIQLPQNYLSALNEIKSQFDNTFDNLNGVRPVIDNLLEIVRSPNHLKKKKFRVSVRRILGWLAYYFHEAVLRYMEVNEHQKGLYTSVYKLFSDSVRRTSRVLRIVGADAKRVHKKIVIFKAAIRHSYWYLRQSKKIAKLVVGECMFAKVTLLRQLRSARRLLMFITQVKEVISDRWHRLKSYFLERMENLEGRR